MPGSGLVRRLARTSAGSHRSCHPSLRGRCLLRGHAPVWRYAAFALAASATTRSEFRRSANPNA
jgi:hypothetical protein